MTPRRRRQIRKAHCRVAGQMGLSPEKLTRFKCYETFPEPSAAQVGRLAPYLVGMDFGFQDRTVQQELLLLESTGLPKSDLKSLAAPLLIVDHFKIF